MALKLMIEWLKREGFTILETNPHGEVIMKVTDVRKMVPEARRLQRLVVSTFACRDRPTHADALGLVKVETSFDPADPTWAVLSLLNVDDWMLWKNPSRP